MLTIPRGGKAHKDTLCCLSEPLQGDALAQSPSAVSTNGTWAQLTLWYMYTQKVKGVIMAKNTRCYWLHCFSVIVFTCSKCWASLVLRERGEQNGAVVERNAVRMVCRRKWDGVCISISSVPYFTFSFFFLISGCFYLQILWLLITFGLWPFSYHIMTHNCVNNEKLLSLTDGEVGDGF